MENEVTQEMQKARISIITSADLPIELREPTTQEVNRYLLDQLEKLRPKSHWRRLLWWK